MYLSLLMLGSLNQGCDSYQKQFSLWLTHGNLSTFCGSQNFLAATFWLMGLHISWHLKWLVFHKKFCTWNLLNSPWFLFILVTVKKKGHQHVTATLCRFLKMQSKYLFKQILPCIDVYSLSSYTAYIQSEVLKLETGHKLRTFETMILL